MVKQVVVSEAHTRYLRNVKNQERSNAGLIIGKTCGNRDYVSRLVTCPSQGLSEMEETSAAWVAGHAAQVVPSLPGGVDVIGVFVIAPTAKAKETDTLLKQMLYQTYRLLSKLFSSLNNHFDCQEQNYDDIGPSWTVVHANPEGNVLSCRQFDVKDNKDVGRPAEWKVFDNTTRWDCLRTHVLIDHSVFRNSQSDEADISKSALDPLYTKIARAFVVFDTEQKQMKYTDILNLPGSGNVSKKTKKAKSLPIAEKDYTCQLFLPLSDSDERNNVDQVTEANMYSERLDLYGNMVGISFVPPGVTVGDAIQDLKRDLVKSLYQRFQVLTEDASDTGGIFASSCQIVLPQRAFCQDSDDNQGSRIIFTDYLFPEDPFDDYKERMNDNFDLTVEDQVIIPEEATEKFPAREPDKDTINANTKAIAPSTSQTKKIVLSLVTIAVAALGWAFSGMSLSDG